MRWLIRFLGEEERQLVGFPGEKERCFMGLLSESKWFLEPKRLLVCIDDGVVAGGFGHGEAVDVRDEYERSGQRS